MFIPIYISHTEEIPVGNCTGYNIKVESGVWRCIPEKQYAIIEQQRVELHERQYQAFMDTPYMYAGIGCIIIGIIWGIWVGYLVREISFCILFAMVGAMLGGLFAMILYFIATCGVV